MSFLDSPTFNMFQRSFFFFLQIFHLALYKLVVGIKATGVCQLYFLSGGLSKEDKEQLLNISLLRYSQKETPGLFSWEFSCNPNWPILGKHMHAIGYNQIPTK